MSIKSFDKWANFYDLIYNNYRKDIEFYRLEAKKAKSKVLEIACGTGRIYLELLKDSIDVYGIDISKNMLNVLKRKTAELGLKSKVYNSDMRNFKLKYKFSLIILPFSAFLHNLTIDDQLKTLKNIRKHLFPEGKLILDFFFPNKVVIAKTYGKKIKTNDEKFILIDKSDFSDEPNQIIKLEKTLIKNDKVIWKIKLRIALIYKREFELLLRLAGYRKWEVYGDFNYKPLQSSKQRMVWIIEK